MLSFTSPPTVMIGQTRYALPVPNKSGRSEVFDDETTYYTNIFGERIAGTRKWRFKGDYSFNAVNQTVINQLTNAYNSRRAIRWNPHTSHPSLVYRVLIKDFKPVPVEGYVNKYNVNISLEGVELVTKYPNVDNLYDLYRPTKLTYFTNA